MNTISKTWLLAPIMLALPLLSGCAPEVGSDAWCAQLKEKPRGDWTVSEVGDYAKHCLLK